KYSPAKSKENGVYGTIRCPKASLLEVIPKSSALTTSSPNITHNVRMGRIKLSVRLPQRIDLPKFKEATNSLIMSFKRFLDSTPCTSSLKYKTSPLGVWILESLSTLTPHFLAKPSAAPVGFPSL